MPGTSEDTFTVKKLEEISSAALTNCAPAPQPPVRPPQ